MKNKPFVLLSIFSILASGNMVFAHEDCELKTIPKSLNYEMFGAKSDGKYDDGIAIKKAHKEANYHKIPVVASKSNVHYYIKNTKNIEVATNTDLKGAYIYIDENYVDSNSFIFRFSSKRTEYKAGDSELSEIQDILENGQASPYVSKYNNQVITGTQPGNVIFKRYLSGNLRKYDYKEFVAVVDNKVIGDVYLKPSKYNAKVTSAYTYNIDKTPVSLSNVNFRLSGNSNNKSESYQKYVLVQRSNVALKNISVKIQSGKVDTGSKQRMFFDISNCINSSFTNIDGINFKKHKVGGSTYLMHFNQTINFTIDNLKTPIREYGTWGAINTNYSKDFTIKNSKTSRFDSHLYGVNMTVENCVFGNDGGYGLTLEGFGKLNINNVGVIGRRFISYREDYGSTWDGDISITNSYLEFVGDSKNTEGAILSHYSLNDKDFGHQTKVAESINIDNFTFYDPYNSMSKATVLRLTNTKGTTNNVPIIMPSVINVNNVKAPKVISILSAHGDYSQEKESFINVSNIDFNNYISNKNIATNRDGISILRFNNVNTNPYSPNISIVNCQNVMVGHKNAGGSLTIKDSSINRINTSETGAKNLSKIEITNSKLNANIKPMQNGDTIYNLKAKEVIINNVLYNVPKIQNNSDASLMYRSGIFDKNGILDNISVCKLTVNSNFNDHKGISPALSDKLAGYVTRAEFVRMINKKFNYTTKTTLSFSDVPKTHAFYNDISIAANAKYINTTNKLFNPDKSITREEVASIITTIMNCKDGKLDKIETYTDFKDVSSWAKTSVEGAIEKGYLGQGSKTFRPKDKLSLSEANIILSRLK